MQHNPPRRYGVIEQVKSENDIERACESIRQLGYGVIDGGYDVEWLASLSRAFDRAKNRHHQEHGGLETLRSIDEHDTIRLPLAYETSFLELATNDRILEVCRRMIADYVILNQQNGIINPPNGMRYNQGTWHRDLPYQHFVSSRPLAINALFCLDEFTIENGATMVLPASHRLEAFPSDHFVGTQAVNVTAPAGAFIVLDCMVFHSGGVNVSTKARRAVNHVYSIPLIRQQIDLPAALGDNFIAAPELRRLLGYDVRQPRSVTEYLASRAPKS
ncbi:phytanoyl-CoA dioxygenase family protein [Bradyrhizobium sp. ISRA443]|uniref:phytanoyl-CoA dioxygenase family protein n=1 Tax=unclassified Bradyrhizobium TaxID=2631580 RepID=UPI00247975BB|nr:MULTISPECIES: phytanoyl-CoA dioxygenase family protein [unclassified Bradyrhizobium]WGR96193.1 phytanoyl-CoA dioxygenase family protein [Bradyrhizobium sp. ISRA435]WGS02749.1 phytanoyl-CoA dioxygenase family protein [Bradyrhizobium sp. ISRA436]WGS09635.1 phytanoyl-CoA dioxygenase family protein [Bradyrhizobium sp. ISRA437]WGS16519.1 phytanoyl-CoA dioxygenase family protein [Bradyrhizobium sp. ISRA443]